MARERTTAERVEAEQAARNAAALETHFADRDDIGDDPETLRVIAESRETMRKRTEAYLAGAKKAVAPGAAPSSTGKR